MTRYLRALIFLAGVLAGPEVFLGSALGQWQCRKCGSKDVGPSGCPICDSWRGGTGRGIGPRETFTPTLPTESDEPFQRPLPKKSGSVVIRVPAEAVVEIEGSRMKQSGERRRFETPPLDVREKYFYMIKATWQEEGKPIARQQLVGVRAEKEVTVDLRPAGAKAARAAVSPKQARVAIQVPDDAEVEIEGVRMQQGGAVRDFVTPPLDPGKKYDYAIGAAWLENGKVISRQRMVNVQPGDNLDVDMRKATQSVQKASK